MTINDFIIEFEKRLTKTKKIGTVHYDNFLTYRLIKSANLSEQDKKMVKATCDLKYEEVKSKLRNRFGDSSSHLSAMSSRKEEVYEAHNHYNNFQNKSGHQGG